MSSKAPYKVSYDYNINKKRITKKSWNIDKEIKRAFKNRSIYQIHWYRAPLQKKYAV